MYSSGIIKEDNRNTKTNVVKVGLKATLKKINLSADIDTSVTEDISTSAENRNQTLYLEYKGGEGVGGTYNLENGYPSIDKYSWEKSVTVANAGLTKINWEKAYPIYEFISDPVKKQQVKDAVVRYIENSQLPEPLKLLPMYEMYAPLWEDRFYVFSWEAVQAQIREYKNQNWGFKGYILAKSEANTKPIYEMHAPLWKDRFYVFSWEEVQAQIREYKNENWGLKGYVLTEPTIDTKPIYEMCDPFMNDRFYVFSLAELQLQVEKYNNQNFGHRGYIYN